MCNCLPKQSSVQTHWAASWVESTHQWSREEAALYVWGNNHSSDSLRPNHAPIVLPHNKTKPIKHTVPNNAQRAAEKEWVCERKRDRKKSLRRWHHVSPLLFIICNFCHFFSNTIWSFGIFVGFVIKKFMDFTATFFSLWLMLQWLHSSADADCKGEGGARGICRNSIRWNIPFCSDATTVGMVI